MHGNCQVEKVGWKPFESGWSGWRGGCEGGRTAVMVVGGGGRGTGDGDNVVDCGVVYLWKVVVSCVLVKKVGWWWWWKRCFSGLICSQL